MTPIEKLWAGKDVALYCGYCDELFTARPSTKWRHEKHGTKPCCQPCRKKRCAEASARALQKYKLQYA